MSGERFLAAAQLQRLAQRCIDEGTAVFGRSVRNGRSEYRRLKDATQLQLDAPTPVLPLKSLFLPPTEALFTWRRQHNDVSLTPADPPSSSAVVLGAPPCDAAALAALDKVMGWDYRDEPWFARRDATTIVVLACDEPAADCFCHLIGLAPDSERGADVLLSRRPGGFGVRALTEKGRALLQRAEGAEDAETTGAGADQRVPPAEAPSTRTREVDLGRLRAWLASHFDDPLWAELGARCHGCGACAAVCPTCHCFDIVDEPDGLRGGARRRNWDTCQASKFTLHASGHNPRADQAARFRQRILHKFSIYPERFGETLCTGCGRCAAACPAGQNLQEILGGIAAR